MFRFLALSAMMELCMYKKHKLLATSISAIQSDSQNAVSNAATATNPKFLTYENSTLGIKI
jgi:hypothetical protein